MKDKKQKHLEDILEEYIELLDEQIEIPLLVEKTQKKFAQLTSSEPNPVYKHSDAEDLFRLYLSLKKHEDRRAEINAELADAEEILKEFLTTLKGGKVSYEKKDDNDKSKLTFLFWLEDDKVKCNR